MRTLFGYECPTHDPWTCTDNHDVCRAIRDRERRLRDAAATAAVNGRGSEE